MINQTLLSTLLILNAHTIGKLGSQTNRKIY